MDHQDSEYIYVPVPRHLVPEVQAYIVRHSGTASAEAAETGGGKAGSEDLSEQWTAEILRQLAETQLSSTQSVSRVLDVLAEQPGDYVSTTHLVENLDIDRLQLRGALSALTRHLNKHFDGRYWPMTWVERLSPSPDYKTEFFYSVDSTIAQRWKEVRTAA
ncbi:hypothetical protein DDQ41_12510 [Streptomyces spongiicola]|uniref:Uncharacterized protein n=1 Tax=Streptomyces spongiicola TaxID=1690221 RepID=A0ABN5KSX3_9ACTN|nr:hypothetical protein [Streptomyces spongiicola]AWK09608.1 hypothetical protein DDQ41_12510 [Streptomyces spongiicola]